MQGGTLKSKSGGAYKSASFENPSAGVTTIEGALNDLKLRSHGSGKGGSWSAPASAVGSFGVLGADEAEARDGKGKQKAKETDEGEGA